MGYPLRSHVSSISRQQDVLEMFYKKVRLTWGDFYSWSDGFKLNTNKVNKFIIHILTNLIFDHFTLLCLVRVVKIMSRQLFVVTSHCKFKLNRRNFIVTSWKLTEGFPTSIFSEVSKSLKWNRRYFNKPYWVYLEDETEPQ